MGNMKETSQDEIVIQGIGKEIFSNLLQYIYTGERTVIWKETNTEEK